VKQAIAIAVAGLAGIEHLPVEGKGGERHERGLRPRQPAQQ